MQTTSGLLAYLNQRLGSLGTPMLVLLVVALAAAGVLAAVVVAEFLAVTADPVQVAPVRWIYRS